MSEPMPQRRTADELMVAAEERLEAAEQLPARLESLVCSAENEDGTVLVEVNSHGALTRLALAEPALALGEVRLGEEIVRLAAEAHHRTLVETVGTLSYSLGDAATLELARDLGLGDMIQDAAPAVHGDAANELPPAHPMADEDEDIQSFDFSQFRSDR